MARTSTTGMSMSHCKEVLGWPYVFRAEQYIPFAGKGGVHRDLFEFGDLVCITAHEGGRVVAVQACGSDLGKHKKKMEETPALYAWLSSGADCEIQAWRRLKVKRGGKRTYWDCRRIAVRLDGDDGLLWEDIR